MKRSVFYDAIRKNLFGGKITPSQLAGIEAVLNEWEQSKLTDLRHLAYMLATAYHETAKTMQAIEEWGKGKGKPYGKNIKHSGVLYAVPARLYYGRGLVQLTWYENYELMGRLLGIDLLRHPEKALELNTAVKIMFEGMLRGSSSFGDFTGRCLEQYFNDKTTDWVNARRIINGTDCAVKIAGQAETFYLSLKKAA